LIVFGMNDAGHGLGLLGDALDVNGFGYVAATMADENTGTWHMLFLVPG
jgi:hypothetical protein